MCWAHTECFVSASFRPRLPHLHQQQQQPQHRWEAKQSSAKSVAWSANRPGAQQCWGELTILITEVLLLLLLSWLLLFLLYAVALLAIQEETWWLFQSCLSLGLAISSYNSELHRFSFHLLFLFSVHMPRVWTKGLRLLSRDADKSSPRLAPSPAPVNLGLAPHAFVSTPCPNPLRES